MENGMSYFKKKLVELDLEIIKEYEYMKAFGIKRSEKLEQLNEKRMKVYLEFLASHEIADGVIDTFLNFENEKTIGIGNVIK